MRRILTIFLILCLSFSLCITAFAADSKDQDVYAKYIGANIEKESAPVEDGKANVELPDGTEVAAEHIPTSAVRMEIIPIPQSEQEAYAWFAKCMEGIGTPISAYDIYFLDADNNRINADGATVTIARSSYEGELIVCSVSTNETAKALTSTIEDGKITFETDGSNYYITAEKKAITDITVPVRGDENEIHADVTIDDDTVELHELDFDEIDHIVGDHVNTGIVEIDLTELNDEIVKIELPMASIKHIVEAAEEAHNDTEALQIDFPNGSVKLDDKTLRAIIDTVGEETTVDLVLESVGTDRLNDTQDKALEGAKVYGGYEAYLVCNNTGVRVSDFKGGVATLSVPFEIPNGLKAEKFAVWYVADDGKTEKLDTHYEDGHLVWDVGHFSDFIIVYEGEETPITPGGAQTGDNSMIWLWVTIAVVAAGMIFFLVFWKRRKKDEVQQ